MSETTVPRNRLLVTSAPHLHGPDTTARIMWEVNLALLPALIMAIWYFRERAVMVMAFSVLGAVLGEILIQRFFLGKPATPCDGSAVLTGLLMSFCVPAAVPAWIAFVGGAFATIMGKQVFGGLGQNIFNPAHIARGMLLASWPLYMTTWLKPVGALPAGVSPGWMGALPDGVTQATPLGFFKEAMRNSEVVNQVTASGTALYDGLLNHTFTTLHLGWTDLLVGNISGSLGETCKIALIGGIYLLIRGHITWHIPAAMMGTVFLGSLLVTGQVNMALFHLLAGGLFIGALFMATDMVTCPMTFPGQLLFGFGCGAITLLIRFKGGYPEGVCYSILIMNALVPLIDRFIVPRKFGTGLPVPQEVKA